jgi:glutamyl-Q tRNA(Asp) synthetase
LHTSLVLGANGEKLSKQNGANALDLGSTKAVCLALQAAASALGLRTLVHLMDGSMDPEVAKTIWTQEWAQKYPFATP